MKNEKFCATVIRRIYSQNARFWDEKKKWKVLSHLSRYFGVVPFYDLFRMVAERKREGHRKEIKLLRDVLVRSENKLSVSVRRE